MRAAAIDARWQPVVNLVRAPRPDLARGWQSIGVIDDQRPFRGRPSMRIDISGGWSGISPVQAGLHCTATVWFWTEGEGLGLYMNFYLQDSTGAVPSLRNDGPIIPIPTRQWTSLAVSAEVPPGYDRMRPHFYRAGATHPWWVGGAMVEASPRSSGHYVDGDMPGARWLGTPHASPSVGYPRPT